MKLYSPVVIAIIVAIILTVVIWSLPSTGDFQPNNPSWNGFNNTSSILPVSPLQTLKELPALADETTLLLIPYLDFTGSELEELSDFINRGGTLILADDFGFGNHALDYLGLKARFAGHPLVDPVYYYRNPSFPRIIDIKPGPITGDVEVLTLNHATSLLNIEEDDIAAMSSLFSFLDANGDGKKDELESAGPLPVISQHSLGHGKIILISDPSIFINSMNDIGNNDAFLGNLSALAAPTMVIDQSHLPQSKLDKSRVVVASIRQFLATPISIVGLIIAVMTVTSIPIWLKSKKTSKGKAFYFSPAQNRH